MSIRFQIALLVFMMINAVAFGVGIILVLVSSFAFLDSARERIGDAAT